MLDHKGAEPCAIQGAAPLCVFRKAHYHIGINGGLLPLLSVFVCSCEFYVFVCER